MGTVNNCTIARRKRLPRGGRLPHVNRERKARRKRENRVYGSYYVAIANLPTCVFTRGVTDHRCVYYYDRRPEAHHLKHVASGGQDAGNCLDVCHGAHDSFHSGTTLAQLKALHRLDFKAEAATLHGGHGP